MGMILDFGISVAASSLVNIAIYSVPAVFVGKFSGMTELGRAQMAFSLYSNLLFVTAAVVRLNLSAYARLIEQTVELSIHVNQHLRILAAAMVPLIVIFAGLSPIWSSLIFGQKWQGLSGLLLALAPGYLLAAVFWGVLNPALLISGKHRLVLIWLAGFLVLYAVLTRWLSPGLGAMGVAIAFTSVEILFHPLLFWIYGLKHLEYRKFFPEIAIGAIFMGVLWICAQHALWTGLLCSTSYLLVWCTRNGKILNSVCRGFDLVNWHRSTQNLVLPTDR
jgi:O-antigen/teichoic acid export membrane protein